MYFWYHVNSVLSLSVHSLPDGGGQSLDIKSTAGDILCLGALCAFRGGLSVSRQHMIWTVVVCSSHRTQKVRSCFPGAHTQEETRAPAAKQYSVRVLGRGRGSSGRPLGGSL